MNGNDTSGVRTWIEVNTRAVAHNINVFRARIPKQAKLMAVVKSNAYGHDLLQFSKEAERLGADWLGVDSMVEARALRRAGLRLPMLVLGYTLPELFAEAAENNISLTVSSFETLAALKKVEFSRPLKVHIKVDTGMHRQGFLLSEQKKLLSLLQTIDYPPERPLRRAGTLPILVEGLYTHFANAKNPAFFADTRAQTAEFEKWIAAFKKAGYKPIVHAAATEGALLFPEAHYDMVRIGIGLYGLWPAVETKEFLRDKIILKPALEWKSIVSEIKKVPRGARVGYDYAEMLGRDTLLGIVPVGYWHGYPRALSSIGHVVVRGKECKIVGRVSMDMLTIDLTDVKGARVGDEVVVLSSDSVSPASAEALVRVADASWYELITRLNPLIKRVYT